MKEWLWLFVVIVLEFCALYNIKNATVTGSDGLLVISVICYGLIPICLYQITKSGSGVALVNIVWNILSSMYGILIGIMLFGETITFHQKLGTLVGFLSIYLMAF